MHRAFTGVWDSSKQDEQELVRSLLYGSFEPIDQEGDTMRTTPIISAACALATIAAVDGQRLR
jgi:hypothetical protein